MNFTPEGLNKTAIHFAFISLIFYSASKKWQIGLVQKKTLLNSELLNWVSEDNSNLKKQKKKKIQRICFLYVQIDKSKIVMKLA